MIMGTQIDDLADLIAIVRGIGQPAAVTIIDQDSEQPMPHDVMPTVPQLPTLPEPRPDRSTEQEQLIVKDKHGSEYIVDEEKYNNRRLSCSPCSPDRNNTITSLTLESIGLNFIDWDKTNALWKRNREHERTHQF